MAEGLPQLSRIVNKTYQENQSRTISDSSRLGFNLQRLRPFASSEGPGLRFSVTGKRFERPPTAPAIPQQAVSDNPKNILLSRSGGEGAKKDSCRTACEGISASMA